MRDGDTDRVGLHQHGGLQSQLLLLLDVVAHVAQLLLHHPDRLKVGRVVEGVAPQQQQLESRVELKRPQVRKTEGILQTGPFFVLPRRNYDVILNLVGVRFSF